VGRREFIRLVGGVSLTWPLAANAQQTAIPVIGFLHIGKPDAYTHVFRGFRKGLEEAGYVESQNLEIEFRWANGQIERLPELAADLVHRQVSAIVTGGGTESALAAKTATSTIPIVLAFGGDPVRLGLVTSLSRPGGNVTGVTFITGELISKRFELLCELVPHARTVAYLEFGEYAEGKAGDDLAAAARSLGRNLVVLKVTSERDFEHAFATLVDRKTGALFVGLHSIFASDRSKVTALAAQHKIPAIYNHREFVFSGGLISYGPDQGDAFRQAGLYVGRILKCAKPADLPIQQATRFELVVNLKAAKALGITVPSTLLTSANEVIE
jgi:putative tryptophan/tyrosine transport system substrate-binding protein